MANTLCKLLIAAFLPLIAANALAWGTQGQLFFNTQIPACLWFLAKQKKRKGEVLFIDARKLATMISRVQSELTDTVIERIANTVAAWRGEPQEGQSVGEYPLAHFRDNRTPFVKGWRWIVSICVPTNFIGGGVYRHRRITHQSPAGEH